MRRRAIAKKPTRKIKTNNWDYCAHYIEDDVHGRLQRT
jgi:hypothetical protein